MPLVSVFTPSHDPRFLDECWASLRAQTFQDFEWCVLLNGGVQWGPFIPSDQVVLRAEDVSGVGAAKAAAVKMATGEILVELDHDDLLTPNALEEIVHAFTSSVGFVWSDFRQVQEDGTPDPSRFDLAHGWEYAEDGTCLGMETSPHNVSYIWYAPNHVRAFRRSAYDLSGGYDPDLEIADDLDLMARLYRVTDFHHIPKCLYLQRMWANTQREPSTNARIQAETVRLYDLHVQGNAQAWARRNNLACLDLGGAHNAPPLYTTVDTAEGADLRGDVFDVLGQMEDSSVGVVRAVDFLEHVPDKVRLMNEIHRVLAHGGMLFSLTPSSDGRGAFQDPTHVSFYNENSFWYFTDPAFACYVPEITARFQVSRLVTYFPTPWHVEHQIPYVCANLVALKGGPRQGGICAWG